MKKIMLFFLLATAIIQLSSCSKKSDSGAETVNYGDLPSQLATDAY